MNRNEFPYLPADRDHQYVGAANEYMQKAKAYAQEQSLDNVMPTASVIVKNNVVIGIGANGSDYHLNHECERVKQNVPTGQGYELCEGCHPKNHSEPRAIAAAVASAQDIQGADLYLWGHYWCCQPCWNSMIDAGIKNVYLLENSEVLFNKKHPENVVGTQFS